MSSIVCSIAGLIDRLPDDSGDLLVWRLPSGRLDGVNLVSTAGHPLHLLHVRFLNGVPTILHRYTHGIQSPKSNVYKIKEPVGSLDNISLIGGRPVLLELLVEEPDLLSGEQVRDK